MSSINHSTIASWKLETGDFSVSNRCFNNIRYGMFSAGSEKKTILFLPGFGDSMLNHDKLMSALAESGFRVISFDYPGQGGSEGTMNQARIGTLSELADKVWSKLLGDEKHQKMIVGWSTGGLVAYQSAYKNPETTSKVALIAPGLAAYISIGEGMFSRIPNQVSRRTLLSSYCAPDDKSHPDPIRPITPFLTPAFSINLLWHGFKAAHFWTINNNISGHVFLAEHERYIDNKKTTNIINKQAPHFKVDMISGAAHEIDNEQASIAEPFLIKIVNFLQS